MGTKKQHSEAGNVFFALFGAVALVGVVGAASMQIMRGPVRSMSEVTKRTVAENNMIASSKLALLAATSQANSGDCDADNFVEPIPFEDAGASPKPTGGGYLPSTIGAALNDPWDTRYGYCVWNHGATTSGGGCPAGYLAGANSNAGYAIAIISAGPDRTFNTTCSAYPTTTALNKAAGSDDVVLGYTYAEAESNSGGLWNLQSGNPNVAEIKKNLAVKDGGGTTTFALDAATGIGDFLGIATNAISAKTSKIDITGGLKLDTSSVLTGACTDTDALKFDTVADALIRCNGANWVAAGGTDNLGNHIATQNIRLGSYWLSGDGGNEGIGVSAAGDATFTSTGGLVATFNSTNANGSYVTMSRSGTAYADIGTAYQAIGASLPNTSLGINARGANALYFGTNNTSRMMIDAAGNVGIGETNPSYKLDLAAGTTNALRVTTSSGAPWPFELARSDIDKHWYMFVEGTGGLQFFERPTAAGVVTPRVTFMPSGNVGIGTASPAYMLHISGDGSARRGLRISQSTAAVSWDINNFETSAGEGAGNFGINQVGSGVRLCINTSGNVGIGSCTATSKLTVSGQVDVTSNKIINLLNPTAAQDAATKSYVDAAVAAGTGFVETDPQVGTLTANKWCVANAGGTALDCTQNAPAGPDNLGNHIATTTLDLANNAIARVGQIFGGTWHATYDTWIQGGAQAASGGARNLAMLGTDNDSGDTLYLNFGSEYSGGTQIGGPVTINGTLNVTGGLTGGGDNLGAGGTTTGNIVLNNAAPTITLQDSDHRTGFIHQNSNLMYFLSSASANATGWTANGSYWPLTLNMTNDDAVFGGGVFVPEGNVGIGTTAPGSALDVKGTLRLSGSSSGYVGFAPAAAAGSTTYTLPAADGSSGQVLSTNGSGTLSWATAGGGSGDLQTFASSGTWTKPATGNLVRIECWGGGGGGAKGNSGAGGGGGGGGAYLQETLLKSSLSSAVAVTIGSGGARGTTAYAAAGTGGTSSFGTILYAYGGAGGTTWGGGGGGSLSAGNSWNPGSGYSLTDAGGRGAVSDMDGSTAATSTLTGGSGGGLAGAGVAPSCGAGSLFAGAAARYAGGGGSGSTTSGTQCAGGVSLFGGSGGAAGAAGTAGDGQVPGGGGGGASTGTAGNGGDGKCIVYTY